MASRSVLVEEAHVPPHFDNLLQRRVPYEARAAGSGAATHTSLNVAG
jgi:hypothetical protein